MMRAWGRGFFDAGVKFGGGVGAVKVRRGVEGAEQGVRERWALGVRESERNCSRKRRVVVFA